MRVVAWDKAKKEAERRNISGLLRRRAFNQRIALIVCFNLVEAYVNGIAWEHVQQVGVESLSKNHREVLVEAKPVNTIKKLMKVPRIVARRGEGPLHQSREPLKSFLEIVKPFRDSVVHASPFDAPDKFGGYNKLTKRYELDIVVVDVAVNTSLAIIGTIHLFLDREGDVPSWVLGRDDRGRFDVEALRRSPTV
jgi:hypothetical protein